jgi:hypothetical protein
MERGKKRLEKLRKRRFDRVESLLVSHNET